MTNNEYLQQQYREDMRSRNWISFNDWVAQRNPQPQRTWVGLTEKDILEAAVKSQEGISPRNDTLRFAVAIEAKLKEKNNG